MTPERHAARRIRLFGLVAALAMAGLLGLIGRERVSRPIFDQWQRLSPRPAEPTNVEIVWIDEASIRTIGPWPWPRYIMAKLVAKLAEDQPRLIGMDMLFPEADRNSPDAFIGLYPELPVATAAEIRSMPSMDSLFGQVIGQAPVVLGRGGLDVVPVKDPPVMAVEARFTRPLPKRTKSWGQAIANIPVVDDVGLGHGLLNGDPDKDGTVRYVPLAAIVAGQATPGFALELARVASGIETLEPIADGDGLAGIRLGTTWLPTLPDGRMRVPYRAETRRSALSALDILYDLPPSQRVKAKIVIIGLSGAGTSDVISTPLSEKTYGAVVHADALEAMLEGRTLARPGWAQLFEGLLAMLLVGVVVGILPLFRGAGAALGTTGVIVLPLGGSWAAFAQGLLIDPVGPMLTAGAAGLTMLVLLFSKARRDRFALAASLQEQRLGAARAAGELSAARDIQMGMLPRRDTLAGFDSAVELDAVIEPARSIGGDFYDTIRLDNDRVCFLVGDVTGKGVPAALFMALSKALAKSVLLRDGDDLAMAMTRLNDEIARDNGEDMFVTMLVGILNTRTGMLELCNAGHENPWLVTAQGEIRQLSPEGGPPLSVAQGYLYDCESLTMRKGDSIVFVSDGVTEAQNPAGGFFGSARIATVLAACVGKAELSEVSQSMLAEVRAFEDGADATDDLTMLVFRYLT